MNRKLTAMFLALLVSLSLLAGCNATPAESPNTTTPGQSQAELTGGSFDLSQVPEYSGEPYVAINDNVPYFTDAEMTTESFEEYSELDALNRCGVTMASIGRDLMPTEKRGNIGHIRPTGWVTAKYDFVDGKYLYNRCHLIGFQLTGENDNERNLITGTRYMNTQGMLPFENMVADYVKETGNHVLYRVTPVFEGDNPLASGVLMEARSVEDNGEGISFCVFAYNVQPGVELDYTTGESWAAGQAVQGDEEHFVLNTSSRKFHTPDCPSAATIKEDNRDEFKGSRDLLIAQGYSPCGQCKP